MVHRVSCTILLVLSIVVVIESFNVNVIVINEGYWW